MTANELLAARNNRPFTPFRLVMSDGRSYDVRHPELLLVGRTLSVIGVAPVTDGEYTVADHLVRIANDHITSTIPLSVADQVGRPPA